MNDRCSEAEGVEMFISSLFVILLLCAVVGFLVACITHTLTFFTPYHPADIFINIVNTGIIVQLCIRGLISKQIQKKAGKCRFGRKVFAACPRSLRITAAVLIVYGLGMFIIPTAVSIVTGDMEAILNEFYRGLSSLWLAIYVYEFSLLYCYRKLWILHNPPVDISSFRIESR